MPETTLTMADWIQAIAAVAMLAVTVGLYWISVGQASLQERQQVHFQRTERAYLSVSEMGPGLIMFHERKTESDGSQVRKCVITVTIKNYGNTPARLTENSMTHRLATDPLPGSPQYGGIEPIEMFLVKDQTL